MPGAGKSEITNVFRSHGFAVVRFGDQTDKGLKEKELPITEENEREYREKLRSEFGMAVYAIKAEPKITALLREQNVVILDGLYSWEEYVYLSQRFANLILICVFANSSIRYLRLAKRAVRPLVLEEARKRDMEEIEKLNKGGPIAAADYFIENNGTMAELKQKVEALLQQLGIV